MMDSGLHNVFFPLVLELIQCIKSRPLEKWVILVIALFREVTHSH